MKNLKFVLWTPVAALWLVVFPTPIHGQSNLLITEFMAVNNVTLADEDGEYSDWIEVYNARLTPVNLEGWYLTDDPAQLTQWAFPATNIAAGSYVVVFASDKNRRVAGAPLHTNFKLDGEGEYLALINSNAADGVRVVWEYAPRYPRQEDDISYGIAMSVTTNMFVVTGASGRYHVPSNSEADWTQPVYDETGWLSGPTGVGYDTSTNYQSFLGTDVRSAMFNVNASAYARVSFTVNDPSTFQELQLRMRYDDGFVAYLNGHEVARRNVPASLAWNATATGLHGLPVLTTPTTHNFDEAGTAYTVQQWAGAFAPVVMMDVGTTNRFLRLANQSGGVLNTIVFDRTTTGVVNTVVAKFDFRFTLPAGTPADGMGFALLPTSTYGVSGDAPGLGGLYEEVVLSGALGVGFDNYPNGPPNDPNDNHISLHWNGALVSLTPATPSFRLVNGKFHRAEIAITFTGGQALMTVKVTPDIRGTPGPTETLFNNFVISGVPPYEGRVAFGARTGGAWADHDLDNVSIQYGPPNPIGFEDFNLTPSLSALRARTNVLAIHGLNLAASDADFLIVPELLGKTVTLSTNSRLYLSTTTPGAANSAGAAGIAGEPAFSLPGGIYTNTRTLVLSSTLSGSTIRYTTDGTTPTASSSIYSGALAIANSTVVKARVFAPGLLPSRVVAQTYTLLGTDLLTFTSNLPLVIIDTFGQGIVAENKIPASMVFIDTFRGRSSLQGVVDAQVRAGIELRGSSSLGFPKTSMGFETRDENMADLAVSLLGMPAESDWVLYAPYTDKTFMNDFLAYELWDAMGHYAVRHKFVEVFRDTSGGRLTYADYVGIYVLLEKIKIDAERVDVAQLQGGDNSEPNVTGGYIFKRDRFDGNEFTFNVNGGTGFGATTLAVEDPKGAQITTGQKNWLTGWFNQMAAVLSSASYTNSVTGYAAYIDAESFIDHYWIVEMPRNIDGYRLSNYYHKDRGGRLQEGPIWDWNLSFGNANYLEGGRTNGYYAPAVGDADYPWYRRLFSDPDFNQKHIDRWAALRTNVFATSNIMGRVDAITNLLNEAQTRDFVRWPRLGSQVWPNPNGAADNPPSDINYTTPTTYSGIISEMKKWIQGRLLWIDAQFIKTPTINPAGGAIPLPLMAAMDAPAGTIYFTVDGSDPRAAGGSVAANARIYSGPITLTNNARIFARARVGTGANSWSAPAAGTFVLETPKLVVTEIMYHPTNPSPGSTNTDDDFEYIELKNIGTSSLNLRNYTLGGGVSFAFSNTVLLPGQRIVVVKNRAAFVARYGVGAANMAGEFSGQLDNDGDQLVLQGGYGEPILDFFYDDEWYPITDGAGFSLVIVDENASLNSWGNKASWRPSGVANGSPGADEGTPPAFAPVVINELLTHSEAPPPMDSIELRNLSSSPAGVGGWFLTDDFGVPRKYRIPDGTMIEPDDYLVFTETELGATNGPGVLVPFGLDAEGDAVYLFSGDANTNLTGYVHGFDFGAQKNGVTFGRHVISTGVEHFVAQVSGTLGSGNAGPMVGPVVISEVMYRPPDVYVNSAYWNNTEEEYVELYNTSAAPVTLYDPAHPTNTWKLDQAIQFRFPTGSSIPGNGYILVVNFSPVANPSQLASFRAKYGVNVGVPIYGPFEGHLNNFDESVSLYLPDTPTTNGVVPDVLVDRVRYSDSAPWPLAPDGMGFALNRIDTSAYGNEPANWSGSAPTPGRPSAASPPPGIVIQPPDQVVIVNQTASFSVTAGPPGPYRYQWRFNGENIRGATNGTLVLNSVLAGAAGQYEVVVMNNTSATNSRAARLTVLVPITFTAHPQSIIVRPGTNAATYTNVTFSVGTTLPPLSYQWQFNGVNIPGAHSPSYTITNVQAPHDGFYSVVVNDGIGQLTSQAARLSVLINPVSVDPMPPLIISAVAGSTVTLGMRSAGTLPMGYRWRRSGTTVTNVVLSNSFSYFTITNLSTTTTGLWTVVLSNAAFSAGTLVTNALVLLATDSDGDGLPDSWETDYGLNPNDSSDAGLDADHDGVSNRNEYLAGTDPQDLADYLKVNQISATHSAIIQFYAQSNKTYSVQYLDVLGSGKWRKLGDVPPRTTPRLEAVTDPGPITNRVYRLVTPGQP